MTGACVIHKVDMAAAPVAAHSVYHAIGARVIREFDMTAAIAAA